MLLFRRKKEDASFQRPSPDVLDPYRVSPESSSDLTLGEMVWPQHQWTTASAISSDSRAGLIDSSSLDLDKAPPTNHFLDKVGAVSVTSWVISQQSTDRSPRPAPPSQSERKGPSTELRTIKGESLSLFPRPIVKRSSSAQDVRPASRVSVTSGNIATALQHPVRVVPERLADGLRSSTRKIKHSASKLSVISSIDEAGDLRKSRAMKQACEVHASRRCDCQTALACTISEPVDFRHITHALPQHFKDIADINQSDLVADFSAVRASQIARVHLRGIKTQELHTGRCSLDDAADSQTSAVPSLVSSSSCDSLQSTRSPSPASQHNVILLHNTSSHGQPDLVLHPAKESFSRPFHDGSVPKFDSSAASRLYQPSFRSFSMPFYASKVALYEAAQDASVPASPTDDSLSEIEGWSTCSVPELPALDRAEVLTITPIDASAGEVKIYPTTRTTHHISKCTSPATSPVKVKTIVIATDRDDAMDVFCS